MKKAKKRASTILARLLAKAAEYAAPLALPTGVEQGVEGVGEEEVNPWRRKNLIRRRDWSCYGWRSAVACSVGNEQERVVRKAGGSMCVKFPV